MNDLDKRKKGNQGRANNINVYDLTLTLSKEMTRYSHNMKECLLLREMIIHHCEKEGG